MKDNNKKKNKFKRILDNPTIIIVSLLLRFKPILSDSLLLRLLYYRIFSKRLNLKNPQTFSEKLQWLKLYDRKPEYTMMVDKYEAKKFVASIIGKEYIIPTIGLWDKFDDIDFSKLPEQFALKCTHDSGGNIICKDKSKLDIKAARVKINKSLGYNYYYDLREWPYKNVKPRVIVEKFMVDESGVELKDYKFFCFNGDVRYCQVIAGRPLKMTIDFYDKDWRHQDFHEPAVYPHSEVGHNKPLNYKKMIQISKLLCQNIPFVRIDLYNINGHIYFGEITFFPTSGMGGFSPSEWDLKFGKLIKLPS